MLRKAFRMSVHPGEAEEYERRHRPIWPELEQTLLAHGVRGYSIFLDDATGDSSPTRRSRARSAGGRSRRPRYAGAGGRPCAS